MVTFYQALPKIILALQKIILYTVSTTAGRNDNAMALLSTAKTDIVAYTPFGSRPAVVSGQGIKGRFILVVEMAVRKSGGRQAAKLGVEKAKALIDKHVGRFVYIEPDEQCVYVLKSETAGAYKIGITKNLTGRIQGIRRVTDLPDLEMVHKIYATDAEYLESFLHLIFEDKAATVTGSTEFFYLTKDDLRWIASLSNVDSVLMQKEELWYRDEVFPWKERADLIVRIGDLRELSIEKLRSIAAIVEAK